MERVNQYFKDRIEILMTTYPCVQIERNLLHVHNRIQFFVSMYNDTIANNNNNFELEEEYYLKLTEPLILMKFLPFIFSYYYI